MADAAVATGLERLRASPVACWFAQSFTGSCSRCAKPVRAVFKHYLRDEDDQGAEFNRAPPVRGRAAGVYAHVRLRLQRHAIDTLGPGKDGPNDPPTAVAVR